MKCGKCGLDGAEFYPKNRSVCKRCVGKRSAKWHQENRERSLDLRRAWDRKHAFCGPRRPRPESKRALRARLKLERFAGPPRPSFEWLFKECGFWALVILEGKRVKLRRIQAECKKRNKEYTRHRRAIKNMKRRGAEGSHTLSEIRDLYREQGGKCVGCLVELNGVFDRDHIMPVCLGGSNFIENIQLLCRGCNNAKGGKHPEEWQAGKAVA